MPILRLAFLPLVVILAAASASAHEWDQKTVSDTTGQLIEALDAFAVEGVSTTIPFHRAVLASEDFASGSYVAGEQPGWPRAGEEPSS